jgi:steroid delta-isomerase-like uncharacterized protein
MSAHLDERTNDIYESFNAHDVEQYLSFHTEDVFFEQIIADGAVAHGKEELRRFTEGFFHAFPDFKVKVTSSFAAGNRQCEEGIWTGTHRGDFRGMEPTGKSISLRAVRIRELGEDKTSRFSIYFDSASLMRQMGVWPASSTAFK